MPRKTLRPLCDTVETLPCIGTGARTTSPPKACPIACMPRQTPRIGTRGPQSRITSRQMPASFGVQGPGDSTIASGASARSFSAVVSSLRTTRIALDERPDQVDEVPGERVVVVHDDDRGHRMFLIGEGRGLPARCGGVKAARRCRPRAPTMMRG